MADETATPSAWEHGRFGLVQYVGQGGWGRVSLAFDRVLKRRVAIKQMLPELAGVHGMASAFLREAQSAAQVSHPHVVQIHDVLEHDLCLVMEYVSGPSLSRYLADGRRLSVAEVLHILEGLTEGLEALHKQGVIHRDLKPSNLLLLLAGKEGEMWELMQKLPPSVSSVTLKIADFGLAKLQDIQLSMTLADVGTPLYMSPEQVIGDPSTPRTDIYALGVIAYEMLAGHPPFTEGNLKKQHREAPVPELAGYPAPVHQAVARAMAKQPEARYATPHEFAQALRAALEPASTPAASLPAPPVYHPEVQSTSKTLPMNPHQEQRIETFLSRFDYNVRGLGTIMAPHSNDQLRIGHDVRRQEFLCPFGRVWQIGLTSGLFSKLRLVFAAIGLEEEPGPDLISQIAGQKGLDFKPGVYYVVGIYSPQGWTEEWTRQPPRRGDAMFYLVERQTQGTGWTIVPPNGPFRSVFDPETSEEKDATLRGHLEACAELASYRGLIGLDELAARAEVPPAVLENVVRAAAPRYRLMEDEGKLYIQKADF